MLRALLGFDHIAKNVSDTWIATSGYAIARSGGSIKALIIDSTGSLSTPAGASTGGVTQAGIDFTALLATSGMTLFVISFNVTVKTAVPTGQFVYLGSVAAATDANWTVPWSAMPAASQVVGATTAVDLEIDLTAGTVNVYANGVLVTTVALSASPLAAMKTGKLCLFVNFTDSGSSNIVSIRDLYILDNISGDGITQRMSGRTVQPITLDQATGAGWTATNGADVLTTLNVPAATAGAATVTAAIDKTPLQLSMASSIPTGHVVEAISAVLAASISALGSYTKLSTADGSAASVPLITKTALSTTLAYGIPAAAAFPRHPSGARWTNTNINSAALVLTPDQPS